MNSWLLILVCTELSSSVLSSFTPIDLPFSHDGIPLIDAQIEGLPPQQSILQFGDEVYYFHPFDIFVERERLVQISPDLILGPLNVREERWRRSDREHATGIFGIGSGSEFGKRVENFLLVPDERGLTMFPSVENPSNMLGEFGYVDFTSATKYSFYLTTKVSLITHPSRPAVAVRAVADPDDVFYLSVSLSQRNDVIPSEIYDAIIREIRTLDNSGGSSEYYGIQRFPCTHFIDRLPSLEYALLNNRDPRAYDDDTTIRVLLEPRDYIDVDDTTGECKLTISTNFSPNVVTFGVNFFKRVAVYIDYTRMRLGVSDIRAHNSYILK